MCNHHTVNFRIFSSAQKETLYLLLSLSCSSFCSPQPQFRSVQSLSRVQLFATPWAAARQDSLSTTNSQSFLKLMSIQSVMLGNHLILCRPLLLLPSIFLSMRVFSSELVLCIRWPKDWSFSFSISPSNEYSGLISFKIDWFDLLAVQGDPLIFQSLQICLFWTYPMSGILYIRASCIFRIRVSRFTYIVAHISTSVLGEGDKLRV